MTSVEQVNTIVSNIKKVLMNSIENGEKLTPTEFGTLCSKFLKEGKKCTKKEVKKDNLHDDGDNVKPKRGISRWNLYIKHQIALMKEEDASKEKKDRRSSQQMLKEASEKWKAGDNLTFQG